MNWNNLASWEIGVLAGALVVGLSVIALLFRRPKRTAFEKIAVSLERAPSLDLTAGQPALPGGQDRRANIRRQGNQVSVLLSDIRAQSKPHDGIVIDRSTGGLKIACMSELPAGTVLSIRTANAPDDIPWVQIQVRSCVTQDGYYDLGCRFLEQPSWNVLLLFG